MAILAVCSIYYGIGLACELLGLAQREDVFLCLLLLLFSISAADCIYDYVKLQQRYKLAIGITLIISLLIVIAVIGTVFELIMPNLLDVEDIFITILLISLGGTFLASPSESYFIWGNSSSWYQPSKSGNPWLAWFFNYSSIHCFFITIV